jgi:pimeloyl-ACP methyl ester carboxylesterase
MTASLPYTERRPSRCELVPIRTQRYHVRLWGEASPEKTPLFMVHGWMDVAASFQFVVDALSDDFFERHWIIAPDWRGYGLTSGPQVDNYWMADYLADLDALIDHYAGDQAAGQGIDLLGHSMGGNVVMVYAGARPTRIRRLINLEGFGMAETQPTDAPGRYAKWMDEIKAFHRGEMALKAYDSVDGVARRLMKTNRRLSADKALWLAQHWSRENAQGHWDILGDAAHKIVNATLFRLEELLACYARITAPTLCVEASDDSLKLWWKDKYTLAQYHERLKHVPNCRIEVIQDAAHMLHHDQPEQLARLLEDFLA